MKKCAVFSLVLGIFFSFIGLVYADLNDGLVAYYPFNGSAVDATGNGNDGMVYWATLSEDRQGNPNSAYDFNGNSTIEVDPTYINDKIGDQYTISMWVYPRNMTSYQVFGGGQNSNSPRYSGTTTVVNYEFYFAVVNVNEQVAVRSLKESSLYEAEKWYHIVGVYDGAEVRLYVNGERPPFDSSPGDINTSGDIVDFDKILFGADILYYRYLDGKLDEIRIYNRVLSEDEIEALYFEGSEIEVSVDIKPGNCPNPLNIKSKGMLPVAIAGTADLDVTQIDPASIRLIGIAPSRSSIEDVVTPSEPFVGKEDIYDCSIEGPDGYSDIILKLCTQEIVAALGEVKDGEVVTFELTGKLYDGTPIKGEDLVTILKKGKK